jgi:hypothetical protein
MKYLYYILFLTSIHKVELYFIQNNNKPICANCKFFIQGKNECKNFGNIDIVTGVYTYENAVSVRNDDDKCGEYAILFKKNHFKFMTIPYYFLLENAGISFSLSVVGFYIILLSFILFYFK